MPVQNKELTIHETFGSFWIGNTEFALPVSSIKEVVNEPKSYSALPLAPNHFVGLFKLRNMIVPVVDLRRLLNFEELEIISIRKIAIIEYGDLHLGLIFDDTGGVIYSEGVGRVNFECNQQGINETVVEGVLKFDNGDRMVQILDPLRLLNLPRIPKMATTSSELKTAKNRGKQLSAISFQVGHTICALDLRYAQEITDVPKIQHSQIAAGPILGNINLRGLTIPVLDFRSVIGNEPAFKPSEESLKNRKLLILSLDVGRVALLVYSIDSIIRYFEEDILPFAKASLPRHDLIEGCLVDERIVILLDPIKLLSDQGLAQAALSCQEIYPSGETEHVSAKNDELASRQTYIIFTVEKRFALQVSEVCEVINRPEKILSPPYALEFVEGILNLRGELITLINPRLLYGFSEGANPGQKIVIFIYDGQKYGLVVDTIDEIFTTSCHDTLAVPAIKEDDIAHTVSKDVLGCLGVGIPGDTSDMIMILNLSSLVSRCVRGGFPSQ